MTPNEFIFSVKSQLENMPRNVEPLLNIFGGGETINEEIEKNARLAAARQIAIQFFDEIPLEEVMSLIMESLQKDFCNQLLENHRTHVPEPFLDWLDSGKVGCGLLEDEKPYCQCVNYADDYFAILMSRGLTRILYSVIRTFSKVISFGGEESSDINEVSSIMADDFFVFSRAYAIASRCGVGISKQQVSFSGVVCNYCELWYLFHEFSHILVKDANVDELNEKDEEYFADYFAMKSMLAMGNTGSDLKLLYLSCELSLLIFHTFEILGIMQVDSTHPSFKQRIAFLRKGLKRDCSNDEIFQRITNFANIATTVFHDVFLLVTSHTDDEKKYMQSIEVLISSILQKYSSSNVPDYFNSTIELQEIVEGGHYKSIYNILYSISTKCTNTIRDVASKYADNMENITKDDFNLYLRSFNSYKIIIGFINTLKEPLKSVFGDICFLHKCERREEKVRPGSTEPNIF